jgi:hypothetical protein
MQIQKSIAGSRIYLSGNTCGVKAKIKALGAHGALIKPF